MVESSDYTEFSRTTFEAESTDSRDSTYLIATNLERSSITSQYSTQGTLTSAFTDQPTSHISGSISAGTPVQSISRNDITVSSDSLDSSDIPTTNVISSSGTLTADPIVGSSTVSVAQSSGTQSTSQPETDILIPSSSLLSGEDVSRSTERSTSRVSTPEPANEQSISQFISGTWSAASTRASSNADTQPDLPSPTTASMPSMPAQTSSQGGNEVTSTGSDAGVSPSTPIASSPLTAQIPSLTSTSTWWLPRSIQVQSHFSGSSTFNPSVTATLPHAIAPQTSIVRPADSSKITIGFDRGLNYEFLVGHPQTPAQIFAFLPPVLSYPFEVNGVETSAELKKRQGCSVSTLDNRHTTILAPAPNHNAIEDFCAFNASEVQVIQIMHMVVEGRDYLLSVAVLYFPSEFVQTLHSFITDENSTLYQNPNPTYHALAQQIDPSIPLTGLVFDSDDPSGSTTSSRPMPSYAQPGYLGSKSGNEASGSLESTVNSPITLKITRRLAIYLTCFILGVLLWIAASLLLLRHLRNAGIKRGRITIPTNDYEKGGYISTDVTCVRSSASTIPESLRPQESAHKENAPNEAFPDDLIVLGENTVYSVAHDLEYYVAEDGSFYYAGALDSTTDGNESTKQASADLEDIDEFLYSADQEESSVAIDGTHFDLGSLEVDDEGNFVLSDASLEMEPTAVGTHNSETVESYNNRNLYKMMQVANSPGEADQKFSEAMHPTNTWGISDSSRPAQASDYGPLRRSPHGFYSSDSSHNFAQSILGGESIDDYLYNGPIGSDWADGLQIDEIDDDVVDVHINDLDELDEEMYRRLSKSMNQHDNQSGMLHISNVIAAKAQYNDTKTRSSGAENSQNQL